MMQASSSDDCQPFTAKKGAIAAAFLMWGWSVELTGQVPPEMMRSKDKASGMPKDTDPSELRVDSPIELRFSLPLIEARAELT